MAFRPIRLGTVALWIEFKEYQYADPSKPRKTKIWHVQAISDHSKLGEVRWFGRWRKYAFFPDRETVFEQNCLRHIADFCVLQTDYHRLKLGGK